MMRRVCFLALCTAVRATPSGAQLDDLGAPLLTIPLHKGGEEYALLDFFSGDPAHIETTAHQFCEDHSFSAGDKAMIIEHATKQIAMGDWSGAKTSRRRTLRSATRMHRGTTLRLTRTRRGTSLATAT